MATSEAILPAAILAASIAAPTRPLLLPQRMGETSSETSGHHYLLADNQTQQNCFSLVENEHGNLRGTKAPSRVDSFPPFLSQHAVLCDQFMFMRSRWQRLHSWGVGMVEGKHLREGKGCWKCQFYQQSNRSSRLQSHPTC